MLTDEQLGTRLGTDLLSPQTQEFGTIDNTAPCRVNILTTTTTPEENGTRVGTANAKNKTGMRAGTASCPQEQGTTVTRQEELIVESTITNTEHQEDKVQRDTRISAAPPDLED